MSYNRTYVRIWKLYQWTFLFFRHRILFSVFEEGKIFNKMKIFFKQLWYLREAWILLRWSWPLFARRENILLEYFARLEWISFISHWIGEIYSQIGFFFGLGPALEEDGFFKTFRACLYSLVGYKISANDYLNKKYS